MINFSGKRDILGGGMLLKIVKGMNKRQTSKILLMSAKRGARGKAATNSVTNPYYIVQHFLPGV